MYILRPLQQLHHIQLDVTRLKLYPVVLQQTRKVVVHVRKDHIHGNQRIVAFACAIHRYNVRCNDTIE